MTHRLLPVRSSLPFAGQDSGNRARNRPLKPERVRSMFVTVVAVLCHLGGPAADSCVEEIVTDSNMTPDITFQECMKGAQAPLAKWMGEHPLYHSNWRIERYKCVPGHYEIKGRA
jgi:hypothetical protein